MNAGPSYEYHWADGRKIKKPIKLSAPDYISCLFEWVDEKISDEALFPTKDGVPFPKNFKKECSTIMRRLFRVYVLFSRLIVPPFPPANVPDLLYPLSSIFYRCTVLHRILFGLSDMRTFTIPILRSMLR